MSKLILKDEAGKQYQVVSQDEFDEKVNVNSPLSRRIDTSLGRAPINIFEIQGSNLGGNGGAILQTFRDSSPTDGITLGQLSSGFVFGVDNTRAVLNVHWQDHKARIIGANTDNGNYWAEDIAWKTDIQRLEQEIADLKKQIGGVKPSYRLYVTSLKEVA